MLPAILGKCHSLLEIETLIFINNPKILHVFAIFLKNRFLGDTGIATTLIYNKETGRLTEGEFDE